MSIKSLEDLSLVSLFDLSIQLYQLDQQARLFFQYFKEVVLPERAAKKYLELIIFSPIHNYLNDLSCILSSITCLEIFDQNDYLAVFDLGFVQKFDNLMSLSINASKHVEFNYILSILNDKAKYNLKSLRLNYIELDQSLSTISKLPNLKFLDLSNTLLNTSMILDLSVYLPNLVGLNISESYVDNLSSLSTFGDTLEYLDIHGLKLVAYEKIFLILRNMTRLKYLDMSISEHISHDNFDYSDIFSCSFIESLCLLDLSGHQAHFNKDILLRFVGMAKNLKYFIFNITNLPTSSFVFPCFNNNWDKFIKLSHKRITCIGPFNYQTILNSLLYSNKVHRYLTTTLYCLYEVTRSSVNFFRQQTDKMILFQRLLIHFRDLQHTETENLIAITAVFYNLTRGKCIEKWPLKYLSEMINIIVDFLEIALDSQPFVTNAFQIICNNYLVGHASFDRLRLTSAVLHNMQHFQVDNISQTGVVILTIIAAELTTRELECLVDEVDHFRILLKLISLRCLLKSDIPDDLELESTFFGSLRDIVRESGEPIFDYTMQYALSAMWNLTDDCGLACKVFVQERGLDIYSIIIRRFKSCDHMIVNSVYNKVLGLLNNIVEDRTSRVQLLRLDYLEFLDEMLGSECIQIKYFAGGILANLLLLSSQQWIESVEIDKSIYGNKVYKSVENWVNPSFLMASYRSYNPFESLLSNAQGHEGVILWTLWAIRHTLLIESEKYGRLLMNHRALYEEIEYLSLNCANNHIRGWARDIVRMVSGDADDSQSTTDPTMTMAVVSSNSAETSQDMNVIYDADNDDDDDYVNNHF